MRRLDVDVGLVATVAAADQATTTSITAAVAHVDQIFTRPRDATQAGKTNRPSSSLRPLLLIREPELLGTRPDASESTAAAASATESREAGVRREDGAKRVAGT